MRTFADDGQNFFSLLDCLHLLKHVSHAHQVVVKDVFGHIKKAEQSRVGDGVIHITPRFASDHDVAHSQNCKLLRNVCGFNLQNFAELVDPLLPIPKTIQNPDADRVREGLEELGLEVGNLLWHAHPRVHAYSNLRSSLCQLLSSSCMSSYTRRRTKCKHLQESQKGFAAQRTVQQIAGDGHVSQPQVLCVSTLGRSFVLQQNKWRQAAFA